MATALVLSSLDETSATPTTTPQTTVFQRTQTSGSQPPASTVGYEQFNGLWVGTVTESRLPATYSIHLDLVATSDQINGRIDYPEYPCGGVVSLRGLDSNVLTLVETITYGKDLCENNGIMTITLTSPNEAQWNYVSPAASALLQKAN